MIQAISSISVRNYTAPDFKSKAGLQQNIVTTDLFVRSIPATIPIKKPANVISFCGRLPKKAVLDLNPNTVTSEQIKSLSVKIREMAVSVRWQFRMFVDGITDKTGVKATFRIKGDSGIGSLENKISREMQEPHQTNLVIALKKNDAELGFSRIFDLFGARFSGKNQIEIDKIYKAMYSAIENSEFIPEYIVNYAGKGIQPYFTKEQLLALETLCDKMGYTEARFPDLNTPLGAKIKKDGYTSLHISGKIKVIKDGSEKRIPTEIQIRTENVDEVFDAIHIPYDIMNEKNVLQDKSQIEQKLLSPIVQVFQDIKAKKLVDKFYEYQTEYIKITKEGGGILPTPQKYGLPQSASLENIIEIQKQLQALKQ